MAVTGAVRTRCPTRFTCLCTVAPAPGAPPPGTQGALNMYFLKDWVSELTPNCQSPFYTQRHKLRKVYARAQSCTASQRQGWALGSVWPSLKPQPPSVF